MSSSFSPRKDPVVQAFEDMSINTEKRKASLFDWLLGSARLGEVSGVWNIRKLYSLPSSRVSKRCPQAVSWDTGILSTFPLYTYIKICSCTGKTPHCEEQPGVFHHPGPGWLGKNSRCRMAWTAMTQTTRWSDRSLQLPKIGNVAAICRCGTLLSWPSMLEAALDPPCWVHPVLQGDANDQGEDPGAKLHLAELEG